MLNEAGVNSYSKLSIVIAVLIKERLNMSYLEQHL